MSSNSQHTPQGTTRPGWWQSLDGVQKGFIVVVSTFGAGVLASGIFGFGGVSKASFASHLKEDLVIQLQVQGMERDVQHLEKQIHWTNDTLWEIAQRSALPVSAPPEPEAHPTPSPSPTSTP